MRVLTRKARAHVDGVEFVVGELATGDGLAALVLGVPAGMVPDIAGPRVYTFTELMREYLLSRHKRRAIVPVWTSGKAAGAFRSGVNLAPERTMGVRTWEDFLAAMLQ